MSCACGRQPSCKPSRACRASISPGPGPWRILSPRRSEDYWTTEDTDPRRLYHDVLVAIDETRRVKMGSPAYGRSYLMCSTSPPGTM